MTRNRTTHLVPPPREHGFTLVELLVAMAITTVILGATMLSMNDAVKATDAATQITDLNNGLRTAMDMMVRDAMQIGQGLPPGRVIGLASGENSVPMLLPGPIGSDLFLAGPSVCPDPDDPTADTPCEQISAVVPGPGRGPQLTEDGQVTDMITMVEADSAFDQVPLTAFAANGLSVTVAMPAPAPPAAVPVGQSRSGINVTNGGVDDIEAGDLIMLTKQNSSSLVQVTRVSGQQVFFEVGDSLSLNQTLAASGTLTQLRALAPADDVVDAGGLVETIATRIRLITYYLDVTTDSRRPRLVRRSNNGHPTEFNNSLGTVVAFDVDNLQFSYDLADGVGNPSNVKMNDADLAGTATGRCFPRVCSPNQIRKVNIVLSGRSRLPMRTTGQYFHKTLVTQVSLRSLAFVDRYR